MKLGEVDQLKKLQMDVSFQCGEERSGKLVVNMRLTG